jgi:hypothetical protein
MSGGALAAIAAVGDDAGERRADLGFDLGQDRRQRVPVVWISGQGLHMGDELATLRAIKRGGERDLDANS